MNRERWMGVGALLGMFLVGLGCGLWIGRSGDARTEDDASITATSNTDRQGGLAAAGTATTAGAAARAHHEAALRALRETVGLDDRQVEEVHAVFARNQEIVQKAWQDVQPQIERAMEEVHREVASLLRPDQLQRYHEWLLARRGGADPHSGPEPSPSHP